MPPRRRIQGKLEGQKQQGSSCNRKCGAGSESRNAEEHAGTDSAQPFASGGTQLLT